jgi:hypothetical protein
MIKITAIMQRLSPYALSLIMMVVFVGETWLIQNGRVTGDDIKPTGMILLVSMLGMALSLFNSESQIPLPRRVCVARLAASSRACMIAFWTLLALYIVWLHVAFTIFLINSDMLFVEGSTSRLDETSHLLLLFVLLSISIMSLNDGMGRCKLWHDVSPLLKFAAGFCALGIIITLLASRIENISAVGVFMLTEIVFAVCLWKICRRWPVKKTLKPGRQLPSTNMSSQRKVLGFALATPIASMLVIIPTDKFSATAFYGLLSLAISGFVVGIVEIRRELDRSNKKVQLSFPFAITRFYAPTPLVAFRRKIAGAALTGIIFLGYLPAWQMTMEHVVDHNIKVLVDSKDTRSLNWQQQKTFDDSVAEICSWLLPVYPVKDDISRRCAS